MRVLNPSCHVHPSSCNYPSARILSQRAVHAAYTQLTCYVLCDAFFKVWQLRSTRTKTESDQVDEWFAIDWVVSLISLMAHSVCNAAIKLAALPHVRCICRALLSHSIHARDDGSQAWIVMYNPKSKSEKPFSRLAQPRNPVMIVS